MEEWFEMCPECGASIGEEIYYCSCGFYFWWKEMAVGFEKKKKGIING